jgi:3-deoxy-7-phosphoheptulonate synthase
MSHPWSTDSWRARKRAQATAYEDPKQLESALRKLAQLPPLVTSWEIERLRRQVAEAQEGKRFLLQGGDCAETFADCRPSIIVNKLKILLQMSLVLVEAALKPVIRVGRFAGQYAKPRSHLTEAVGGVELPSYFGDIVNRVPFTADARRPDPGLVLGAYHHAALTLNFIRSLSAGGFADAHHPEYWDLSFFQRAAVPENLRTGYEHTTAKVGEALRFMSALGECSIADLTRVEFFASHDALHLEYESAQTQPVPRRTGYYDLSTHFPWIGDRTRQVDGAHVEFFRGVRNPIGIKLGPSASPDEVVALLKALNPENEPGRITLITRMGADRVAERLAPLVEAVKFTGGRVLWVVDPMHGNTHETPSGKKTRYFAEILSEVEQTFDVHASLGSRVGGVHFEMTGEDVTECLGGDGSAITEADLPRNYATACDPRLNYRQSLEMALLIGRRLKADRRQEAAP